MCFSNVSSCELQLCLDAYLSNCKNFISDFSINMDNFVLISLQLAKQLSISINEPEPVPGVNQCLDWLKTESPVLPDTDPDQKPNLLNNKSPSLGTIHTLSPNSSRRSSYMSAESRLSSNASEASRRSSFVSEATSESRRGSFVTEVEEENVMDETPRKAVKSDGVKGSVRKKRKTRTKSRSIERKKERSVSPVTRKNQAGNTKSTGREKPLSRAGSSVSRSSPKPKQKIPANRRKSIRLSSDSRILVSKTTAKSQTGGRRKSIRQRSDSQIAVRKQSPTSGSYDSPKSDPDDSESQPPNSRLDTKCITKKRSPRANKDLKRRLSTISTSSKSHLSSNSRVLSPTSEIRSPVGSVDSPRTSSRRSSFNSDTEHSLDLSLSLSQSQSTRLRSRHREVRLMRNFDVQCFRLCVT